MAVCAMAGCSAGAYGVFLNAGAMGEEDGEMNAIVEMDDKRVV